MRISAALLRRSRTFTGVIAAGVLANLVSALRVVVTPDCCRSVGFPFPVVSLEAGRATDFYLLGLLLDVAVTVTLALLLTWLVRIAAGER